MRHGSSHSYGHVQSPQRRPVESLQRCAANELERPPTTSRRQRVTQTLRMSPFTSKSRPLVLGRGSSSASLLQRLVAPHPFARARSISARSPRMGSATGDFWARLDRAVCPDGDCRLAGLARRRFSCGPIGAHAVLGAAGAQCAMELVVLRLASRRVGLCRHPLAVGSDRRDPDRLLADQAVSRRAARSVSAVGQLCSALNYSMWQLNPQVLGSINSADKP